MKILDLSTAERPREKLIERGARALSDGELLAILLRTGRKGESVLELSQRLLSLVDGRLGGLFECDAGYLASIDGVGLPKAATLLAAFELGRRFMAEEARDGGIIHDSGQVYRLLRPRMKGMGHEECWVILLDSKNRIIKTLQLSKGGRKTTIIDIPSIMRTALENSASGMILIHNHPSGNPEPSRSDIRETTALRDACTSCDISLIDHIIVSDDRFYSFNEEKIF